MLDNKREKARSVLIIGLGFAGCRFLRVFKYMQKTSCPGLRIAICETNRERLESGEFEKDNIQVFTDLDEALRISNPDVATVCVNEFAHFEVLRKLANYPELKILCEKPLTEKASEARALSILEQRQLRVNFVERFSPICSKFIEWHSNNPGFKVVRVESFWGKCRVADKRETMGVLSELIHPLDLVDFLFGIEDPEIVNLFCLESDYAVGDKVKLESIDLAYSTRSFPLLVKTSFAWSGRERLVSAILAHPSGEKIGVRMQFDMPRWDCDTLSIFSFDESGEGANKELLRFATSNADFPSELQGIHKVKEFVRLSLETDCVDPSDTRLVAYPQILKLQEYLEMIETRARFEKAALSYSLSDTEMDSEQNALSFSQERRIRA